MTQQTAIDLAVHAMTTTMIVAAPFLLAGLVVGVVVSIFQAITSIQEPTLSFVPKILAVGVVVAIAGPWMLSELIGYAHDVLAQIATIGAG